MDAVLRWCRENQIETIILHAGNEGRNLYESMGFTATNEKTYLRELSTANLEPQGEETSRSAKRSALRTGDSRISRSRSRGARCEVRGAADELRGADSLVLAFAVRATTRASLR